MKRALQNGLLVLGSLLVFVLVGELVCRLFFPDQRVRYVVDEEMIARFAPNQTGITYLADGSPSPTININELGLRGPSLSGKPSRRILFLGDSFTFGTGVADDQTFTALVDKALGQKVSVVNGGQPGFGIFQAEILAKRLMPVVRPKLVVLVVWEYMFLRQPLSDAERQRVLEKSRWIKQLKSISLFGTYVYRLVEHVALEYGARELTVTLGTYEHLAGTVRDQYMHGLEADKARLVALKNIVSAYGAKLLIVFWPREGYVDPKERKISPQLDRRLSDFNIQSGIGYLSLEGVFDPYANKLIMIPIDGHPTPFAHCIVAQKLLLGLRDYGYPSISQLNCRNSVAGAKSE